MGSLLNGPRGLAKRDRDQKVYPQYVRKKLAKARGGVMQRALVLR